MFALAFHSVNQMLTKGIDPPLIFTPEVLPPPDRAVLLSNFSAIKEIDALNNDTIDLKRDKNNVQEDLKEKEGTSQESQICTSEEELAMLGKSGVAYSKEQQDWGRVWSQGRVTLDLFRGSWMIHSRKSVECKWMERKGMERKELETHSNQ
ncbi:hypothetical protein QTO34_009926 [Cnephaeus nilssonii]|uniref:Uncharacterized protein n=1 Tax=Cnephaeus nilssonii TaxID=3371016 RepID=A0AA40LFJ3_CNENI|nr:hypothetical protein QTO34_009926 [Eptesicus nilssonii]